MKHELHPGFVASVDGDVSLVRDLWPTIKPELAAAIKWSATRPTVRQLPSDPRIYPGPDIPADPLINAAAARGGLAQLLTSAF